jgi:hypothetical protein
MNEEGPQSVIQHTSQYELCHFEYSMYTSYSALWLRKPPRILLNTWLLLLVSPLHFKRTCLETVPTIVILQYRMEKGHNSLNQKRIINTNAVVFFSLILIAFPDHLGIASYSLHITSSTYLTNIEAHAMTVCKSSCYHFLYGPICTFPETR